MSGAALSGHSAPLLLPEHDIESKGLQNAVLSPGSNAMTTKEFRAAFKEYRQGRTWGDRVTRCQAGCIICWGVLLVLLIILLPVFYLVVFPSVAQSSIDESTMTIETASLWLEDQSSSSSPSTSLLQTATAATDAFVMHLASKVTVANAGIFAATIQASTLTAWFTCADGIAYEMCSFDAPAVRIHSNTGGDMTLNTTLAITNESAWTEMTQHLFNGVDAEWLLRGNIRVHVDLLSTTFHLKMDSKSMSIPATHIAGMVASSPVLRDPSPMQLKGDVNIGFSTTGLIDVKAGYSKIGLDIELACAPAGSFVRLGEAFVDNFALAVGYNNIVGTVLLEHAGGKVTGPSCSPSCSPPGILLGNNHTAACAAANVNYTGCSTDCLHEIALAQYVGEYASGVDQQLRVVGPLPDPRTPTFLQNILGCDTCPPTFITATGQTKTLLFNNEMAREDMVQTAGVLTPDLRLPAPFVLSTMYNTEAVPLAQSNMDYHVTLPEDLVASFHYQMPADEGTTTRSGFCAATTDLVTLKRDQVSPEASPHSLSKFSVPVDSTGLLVTSIEAGLAELVSNGKAGLAGGLLMEQCNVAGLAGIFVGQCNISLVPALSSAVTNPDVCPASAQSALVTALMPGVKQICPQSAQTAIQVALAPGGGGLLVAFQVILSQCDTASFDTTILQPALGVVVTQCNTPALVSAVMSSEGSTCSLDDPMAALNLVVNLASTDLAALLGACNLAPTCFGSLLDVIFAATDAACSVEPAQALYTGAMAACNSTNYTTAAMTAYTDAGNSTGAGVTYVLETCVQGDLMKGLAFFSGYFANSQCGVFDVVSKTMAWLESVVSAGLPGLLELAVTLGKPLTASANACSSLLDTFNGVLRSALAQAVRSVGSEKNAACIANRLLSLSCVAKLNAARVSHPGLSPNKFKILDEHSLDISMLPSITSVSVKTEGMMDVYLGGFEVQGVRYRQDSVPLAIDSNTMNTLEAWGWYDSSPLWSAEQWEPLLTSTVLPSLLLQATKLLAPTLGSEPLTPAAAEALVGTLEALVGGAFVDQIGAPDKDQLLCGVGTASGGDDAFIRINLTSLAPATTSSLAAATYAEQQAVNAAGVAASPAGPLLKEVEVAEASLLQTNAQVGKGRKGRLLRRRRRQATTTTTTTTKTTQETSLPPPPPSPLKSTSLLASRAKRVLSGAQMRSEPCATTEAEDNLRVWQLGNGASRTFPEAAPEVGLFNRTMDVGIAFCGGGSRAYSAALGALRVLASKGVMQNIRYISGISGGSWAASVYSYWQQQQQVAGTGASECQFLREYVPPSKLTDRALHAMRPDEMGAGAANDLLPPLLAAAADLYLDTESIWQSAVAAAYFSPFGIGAHDALFAYDSGHVEEMVSRNPSLANRTFFTQRADRPFMVIHSTMLAPTAVISPTEQALMGNGSSEPEPRLFQWTPLYSGVALPPEGPITYQGATDENGSWVPVTKVEATIGGLFETFGLGSKTPARPIEAFSPQATGATRVANAQVCVRHSNSTPTVEAPMRYAPTSLAYAASSSSAWAAASKDYVVANNAAPNMATVITALVTKVTRTKEYESCLLAGGNTNTCLQIVVNTMEVWPAVKEPGDLVTDFTFTDGGVADVSGIVSLIQRNVAQVVAILSTEVPFVYNASYDSPQYVPTGDEVPGLGQFYGFFGVADSLFLDGENKYLDLLRGFNALAKEGKALVFTAPLTTIENAKYDVHSDVDVTLTWIYPSPASSFTNALPTDIQAELAKSTTDPESAYFRFPNYATEFANCPRLEAWAAQAASGDILGVLKEFLASDCDVESLTNRQINLLAGFTGWAIDSNWDSALASVFTDGTHPAVAQEGCTAVLADDHGVDATIISPSIFV